ncbi:MAG: sensor histidine kinase, partial [Anaerolineales bacterium]
RYIALDHRTRSELVVPLRVGDRTLGVLDLQSPEPDAFPERMRRMVAAFAERAALALENAQLLERLELARQIAEEANQLKSEFLANTSHELRTPLTAILGALSIIMDGLCDTPDEEREFLKIAQLSSQSLLSIVNAVLDVAKIEAGKMEVLAEALDVAPVFEDVYSLTRVQADDKKLRLELLPPQATIPVYADPDKLRQILLNLVGNAIKFTERGSVTVHAQPDLESSQMIIEVRDTGIGIPLEKQGKLFQPFVQADGSMTRKHGGTGLGLSISRRLAEMMAGTLTLHSAGEEQGCVFTLALPLADASLNQPGEIQP